MGDEHDRPAVLVELLEDRQDVPRRRGVEVSGRLVREDQLGVGDERAGDGDALLLAAGELVGGVVDAVVEPDHPQRAHRRLAPARRPAVEEGQLDVAPGGELLEQVELLEDEADAEVADVGELVVAHPHHVLAGEEVAPRGGDVETAEDVHQRRLARPRGADDGDEVPAAHLEVDVAQRAHDGLAGAVGLADLLEMQDGVLAAGHRAPVRSQLILFPPASDLCTVPLRGSGVDFKSGARGR